MNFEYSLVAATMPQVDVSDLLSDTGFVLTTTDTAAGDASVSLPSPFEDAGFHMTGFDHGTGISASIDLKKDDNFGNIARGFWNDNAASCSNCADPDALASSSYTYKIEYSSSKLPFPQAPPPQTRDQPNSTITSSVLIHLKQPNATCTQEYLLVTHRLSLLEEFGFSRVLSSTRVEESVGAQCLSNWLPTKTFVEFGSCKGTQALDADRLVFRQCFGLCPSECHHHHRMQRVDGVVASVM
jgi:hypothetical protein